MPDQIDRIRSALEDRYALERELGCGGMATVYLAEDLKHRRKVAIKVLHPELAAVLGQDRFLREIEIAAGLQHPHILPLLDSGQSDTFLYYVMPFVEGESLRGRVSREHELPVGDTIRILRDVTDALAYAHGRGLIHRDIKPDNVMLSGRHALVTDFGVAKAISEATGRRTAPSAGFSPRSRFIQSPRCDRPQIVAGCPMEWLGFDCDAVAIGHARGRSIQSLRQTWCVEPGGWPDENVIIHDSDLEDSRAVAPGDIGHRPAQEGRDPLSDERSPFRA